MNLSNQGAYEVLAIISKDPTVSPCDRSTSNFKDTMNSKMDFHSLLWMILMQENQGFWNFMMQRIQVIWHEMNLEHQYSPIYTCWGLWSESTPQNSAGFIRHGPSNCSLITHRTFRVSFTETWSFTAFEAATLEISYMSQFPFFFNLTLNINFSFIWNWFCESKYTKVIYSMRKTYIWNISEYLPKLIQSTFY